MAEPARLELADEIDAIEKRIPAPNVRLLLVRCAAALRSAEEEIKRLRENIECYENKKWAEIELALADNEASRLWEGMFGKPSDILNRAEKAEAALAEMRRILAFDGHNSSDAYSNLEGARIDMERTGKADAVVIKTVKRVCSQLGDAKIALARHLHDTEGK